MEPNGGDDAGHDQLLDRLGSISGACVAAECALVTVPSRVGSCIGAVTAGGRDALGCEYGAQVARDDWVIADAPLPSGADGTLTLLCNRSFTVISHRSVRVR